MKINAKTLTLTVLIAVSAISAAAALRVAAEPEPKELDTQSTAAFYLRDCEGYIAVYRGGSSTPSEVTEIETATLNDTDAELIRQGIPVMSRNELLLLLEDLCS